MESGVIE